MFGEIILVTQPEQILRFQQTNNSFKSKRNKFNGFGYKFD